MSWGLLVRVRGKEGSWDERGIYGIACHSISPFWIRQRKTSSWILVAIVPRCARCRGIVSERRDLPQRSELIFLPTPCRSTIISKHISYFLSLPRRQR